VTFQHDTVFIDHDRGDVPESGNAVCDFPDLAFGMYPRIPRIYQERSRRTELYLAG
jgi:hypothetical protein